MTATLPDWYIPLEYQQDAVRAVIRGFESGKKAVFLDAPTGTGKSWIGELVRREWGVRKAIYICSSLTLQDQVEREFEWTAVLKGRANYPSMTEGINCDSCTYEGPDAPCWWCDDRGLCPYQYSKASATMADMAVLNTAYYLNETRGMYSAFQGYPLVIADECDQLEQTLRGFIEVRVSKWLLKTLRLSSPRKGERYDKVGEWMANKLVPGLRAYASTITDAEQIARKKNMQRLAGQIQQASVWMGEGWVRDDDGEDFGVKPVKVAKWGHDLLWKKADKWLCMSATIINPQQMADDLGLEEGEWDVVTVPDQFAVENRPIRVVPIANMKNGEDWEERAGQMADACDGVLRRHPDERVLIHAVSYKLANYLQGHLWSRHHGLRPVISYTKAKDREEAIARYRSEEASVLVAPSLDRGVDFRDDDCRVMVVAKIPFPNLGDKMISARMHMSDGQRWYNTETIRTLVQMCGRGVRHKDDHAVTYVLDAGVLALLRRNKNLVPDYFMAAVDFNYPKNKLMEVQ